MTKVREHITLFAGMRDCFLFRS